MKLKNKITGEIKEVIVSGYPVSGKTEMWECSEMDSNEETGYKTIGTYTSLAELNEEWEDYEEPKKHHYYIETTGRVIELVYGDNVDELKEELNKIGNYFLSREEAEKAVEKLKAIQRLKSHYIKFKLDFVKNKIDFTYRIDGTLHSSVNEERIIFEDLALLFGGEE